MSAYDSDPRVRKTGDGQYRVAADDLYLVTAWGEGRDERWNVTLSADARVYGDSDAFAAMLCEPNIPHLFDTEDEAIHSLIGDPA